MSFAEWASVAAGVPAARSVTLVSVRALGRDRLQIGPLEARDARREAILAWLDARPEPLDVNAGEADAGPAPISVRMRTGGPLPAALVRSLRDQLTRLAHRAHARPPRHAEVVHALPGRMRLRASHVGEDDLPRLAAWVASLRGVRSAEASSATASLLVRYDRAVLDAQALVLRVSGSDPSLWPAAPAHAAREHGIEWTSTVCNSVLLGATLSGVVHPAVTGAGIAVAAVASGKRAYHALREGRLSVDLLDLAAILMAVGTRKHATAAFITWLLSIGDVVLAHTTGRARVAIEGLMRVDVQEAWRVTGDSGTAVERVAIGEVKPGDRIVIEAGGSIPVDGTVRRGVAVVDEKALTGESLPHEKGPGDRVLAATVVVEGEVVIEVERIGADTAAARIVQILEGVGAKPMTLQREIERKADWLVLPTFGVASAAGFLGQSLEGMTSVLITDFGTGVRIAVPTSVLATMTVAARDGVLLKGGHYLERLASADTIVFDKTGTLTHGAPRIVDVAAVGDCREDEVVALAGGAEARQRHPIAEAIRIEARARGLSLPHADIDSVSYRIGSGLSATVDGRAVLVGGARMMRERGVSLDAGRACTAAHGSRGVSSVYVAIDGRLRGVLGYADEARAESASVVRALRAGGRRDIVLLSGDARAPVESVARALGIDRAFAELLPEDKAEAVKTLQREGRTVAMVGDGINDAPALALADVGISLEGATEVALETADVVLLSGGLAKLPRTFEMADAGMRQVHRSVALVVAPNVAAMVLGAVGLLPPAMAATINNGSTIVAALAGLSPLFEIGRR